MPAQLLGAHMPVGKGLPFAVKNGKAIGCTAVQVFTSSPRQWYGREATAVDGAALKKSMEETGIHAVVSHDTYLINLCAPTPEVKEKSLKAIKEELTRCSILGIPFVVSHMGAHSGQGEEVGLWGVAEAAKEVLAETPDDVILLMETTAGQGSSLNHRFEHLAILLNLMGAPDRLCVCLDTCHIFAAGYDIRTPETYDATFAEFDRLVGTERIKCIHCNDSQKKLGSRVDRHAHIGEGEIGIEAFRCLVNDPRFENTPILLETPDADTMHEVNLKRLWDLREV